MTVISFFSGAIMYSYLIARLFFKVDIRQKSADGNPGSSNVIRAVGVPAGLVCMGLDVAKAFVPVFISVNLLGLRGMLLAPVAVAPVAGHAFSPMMRFNGGKAISTTYGALLGLLAVSRFVFAVAVIMAFFRFVLVVRPDSAGSIVDMAVTAAAAVIFTPTLWFKTVIVLIAVVVTVKQLQRPDKGEYSVSVWHYSLALKDNRLKFSKT
jgi:acyl phosphate:glycerol-3-phosphate acyltransferase